MSIFLETKRLLLKTPELTDLDKLVALRSNFEVMKYTGEGGPQTIYRLIRLLPPLTQIKSPHKKYYKNLVLTLEVQNKPSTV